MLNRVSYSLLALALSLCPATAAAAQISVQFGIPSMAVGINVPSYPRLALVPSSPVYYAPEENANYFFYDGLYWIFTGDNWYASSWYDGPWDLVSPYDVPSYLLLVPVRYYHSPPAYFRAWRSDAPPRWNRHWGHEWSVRRAGWDRWDARALPPPAPPPIYQRFYSGNRYPWAIGDQLSIRTRQYNYEPRENVTRQHYAERSEEGQHYQGRQERSAPQDRGQRYNPARRDQGQRNREPQSRGGRQDRGHQGGNEAHGRGHR